MKGSDMSLVIFVLGRESNNGIYLSISGVLYCVCWISCGGLLVTLEPKASI